MVGHERRVFGVAGSKSIAVAPMKPGIASCAIDSYPRFGGIASTTPRTVRRTAVDAIVGGPLACSSCVADGRAHASVEVAIASAFRGREVRMIEN